MNGLVKVQPIDFAVTKGPRATFGETRRASHDREQSVGELSSRNTFENDIYEPFIGYFNSTIRPMDKDFFAYGIENGRGDTRSPISLDTFRAIEDQNFHPDAETLQKFVAELDAAGIEYPSEITPDAIEERRGSLTREKLSEIARYDEVLGRSSGFSGLAGNLAGGFTAGFDNLESVVTMPIGAASRAGIMITALVEGGVNAATEAGTTPTRNKFLRELGLPEESILENAAFGFAVGGTLGGLMRTATKGFGALADRREVRQALAEIAKADQRPSVQAAADAVLRDVQQEKAAVKVETPEAVREYTERAQEAAVSARDGRSPDMPDRPLSAIPDAAEDGSVLVDPRELLVQPDVFQFKSDIVADGGVTAKLQGVKEWVPHRAGVAIVYEYPDGSRAIADGHQRTALANRIMADDPSQNIRLRAEIFRAEDGFTVEDVRVLAALKNIAEAADGMTARMAGDAAKVLRIKPDAIASLPKGPGIARAQNLAKLSDDAFDLYINRVIDERFAEQIGRMVDDPTMHLPIARLIERVQPQTTEQAKSVIAQALEAPVSREKTADLFGETEVVESLYLEQAKVLERSMQIMREDRSVFKTLTEQAQRIEGSGANKLDKATNAEIRQHVETALAAIKSLAHRAGPISEALRDGAKSYKETGRLKEAAQSVAAAVRREVQRNGLDGLAAGAGGRATKPDVAGKATLDPNAEFADPVGQAAKDQVEATRIEVQSGKKQAEGFSEDRAGLDELKRLVDAGADRAEIDNHPVVLKAIEDMSARPETRLSDGYGTEHWHEKRKYSFDGEDVIGTEDALIRWVDGAESLAARETGVPFSGVKRNKELTIITGPPAAGKSTIANDIALARGAAILDSDEIKKTIPEFDGGIGAAAVHEESSDLTGLVENLMMEEGTNIVLPKVGSKASSIARTIDRYKAAGYEVRLVNMNVTAENAYRRMIARFVATGRLIPPSYVDEVGNKPASTFRKLKREGKANGFAEIDNNGGLNEPKSVSETSGVNALEGSKYDPEARGSGGQGSIKGGAGDSGAGVEQTKAGEQTLIEGVAPITPRDRLEAAQQKPLAGGAAVDDTQIGGLFDPNDPSRFDLFDAVPVERGFDADGKEIAITKSRAEVAADLNAEDEFLDTLEVCL